MNKSPVQRTKATSNCAMPAMNSTSRKLCECNVQSYCLVLQLFSTIRCCSVIHFPHSPMDSCLCLIGLMGWLLSHRIAHQCGWCCFVDVALLLSLIVFALGLDDLLTARAHTRRWHKAYPLSTHVQSLPLRCQLVRWTLALIWWTCA